MIAIDVCEGTMCPYRRTEAIASVGSTCLHGLQSTETASYADWKQESRFL